MMMMMMMMMITPGDHPSHAGARPKCIPSEAVTAVIQAVIKLSHPLSQSLKIFLCSICLL